MTERSLRDGRGSVTNANASSVSASRSTLHLNKRATLHVLSSRGDRRDGGRSLRAPPIQRLASGGRSPVTVAWVPTRCSVASRLPVWEGIGDSGEGLDLGRMNG